MAYASLATCYFTMGNANAMEENARKAFELRERVSQREKYYIESHYYHIAVGDLEKARQVYELSARAYPRDDGPFENLGELYNDLGQYDKALISDQEARRLNSDAINTPALAGVYLYLNRFEEAQSLVSDALAREPESYHLHFEMYSLAFLRNDTTAMDQQVAWGTGSPGLQAEFLSLQAFTDAYSGRFANARELIKKAVALAEHSGDQEMPANFETADAYIEALSGNAAEARQRASRALQQSNGKYVQTGAAYVLALAGDTVRAQVCWFSLKWRSGVLR
jgi:tetratricopeptide (TPR) repeat protein